MLVERGSRKAGHGDQHQLIESGLHPSVFGCVKKRPPDATASQFLPHHDMSDLADPLWRALNGHEVVGATPLPIPILANQVLCPTDTHAQHPARIAATPGDEQFTGEAAVSHRLKKEEKGELKAVALDHRPIVVGRSS
jgi:hypothetical protein